MKTLAALAADGCMASCPRTFADIAAYADRALGTGALGALVVAKAGGPAIAFGGASIQADADLSLCDGPSVPPRAGRRRVDCLCLPVPLGPIERLYEDSCLAAEVRRIHGEGALIAAPCASVFLLAAAGLLEGGRVPVHPSLADRFESLFPEVEADRQSPLLDQGSLIVSVGAATAADLGVLAVARLCGREAAEAAARVFLDSGGSLRLALGPGRGAGKVDDEAARAAHFIERSYAKPIRLADVARAAGLEERTLARRFAKRYGKSPMDYLREVRCEAAAGLLSATGLSAAEVAWRVGYSEASSFSRAFKAVFGSSPSEAR